MNSLTSFSQRKMSIQRKMSVQSQQQANNPTPNQGVGELEEGLTEAQRAAKIEAYLSKERDSFNTYRLEPKLLILGSSDSGKSTLLKQLKILHGGGFSEIETNLSKLQIQSNILFALTTLISGTPGDDLKETYEQIYSFFDDWQESRPPPEIPLDLVELCIKAWQEQPVKFYLLMDPSGHKLPDTTEFFLNKVGACLAASYIPSNEDILKLRTVTQSISDTIFLFKKKRIHFIDVSGLTHHRKAWLSFFDDVNTILFVVSLSSYDQTLVEDPSVNRMADALVLFEQISNHTLLNTKDIILFFNKKDIFEVKAKKVLVKDFFPEYTGKDFSVSQSADFFRKKFIAQAQPNRKISFHVTCATSTEAMEVIISGVLESVVTGLLTTIGLV